MQVKLLKDVVISIAGPIAAGVVDLLYGKKNVNEFIIAKKLKLNINQTRNILYKLADHGLVSFIGKKDRKNGGWYTYFWTLDIEKSFLSLRNVLVKEIEAFEAQLQTRKNTTFYYCPSCEVEMDEEQALLNNFTCPECGQVLVLQDAMKFIPDIEKGINKNKEYLEMVNKEIGEVEKKSGISKARKLKAKMKKKKEERAERMKVRKKEFEKLAKLKKKAKKK